MHDDDDRIAYLPSLAELAMSLARVVLPLVSLRKSIDTRLMISQTCTLGGMGLDMYTMDRKAWDAWHSPKREQSKRAGRGFIETFLES